MTREEFLKKPIKEATIYVAMRYKMNDIRDLCMDRINEDRDGEFSEPIGCHPMFYLSEKLSEQEYKEFLYDSIIGVL